MLFINGCVSSNNNFNNLNKLVCQVLMKLKSYDNYIFQEHLNRIFKTEIDKPKIYSLKTSISFESANALTSVNLTP